MLDSIKCSPGFLAWAHENYSNSSEPTRSLSGASDAELLGTIMVSNYRVGRWQREVEWFMAWGERQMWRSEGTEEQTDVNGPLATHVVQAWTIAKSQVLVQGPEADKEVWDYVCWTTYGSRVLLQLRSVLTSMDCVTTKDHSNHMCWGESHDELVMSLAG